MIHSAEFDSADQLMLTGSLLDGMIEPDDEGRATDGGS